MLGAHLFEAQFRHGNTNFRGTDFEVWCELSWGHGDRYIGSLFRVDEPVPDDFNYMTIKSSGRVRPFIRHKF